VKKFDKRKATTIHCPDMECKGFEALEMLCLKECPYLNNEKTPVKKSVECPGCYHDIYLKMNHSGLQRVDCPECGVMNFNLLSGYYLRKDIKED
jgi:hypothetical protein